jgi:hypothetical protein
VNTIALLSSSTQKLQRQHSINDRTIVKKRPVVSLDTLPQLAVNERRLALESNLCNA